MVFTSLNRSRAPVDAEEKYPALQIVLILWKGLIVLFAIGTLLGAVMIWRSPERNRLAYALLTMLVGAVVCLFQWAQVELVQVVLDIEENTRRAADRHDS